MTRKSLAEKAGSVALFCTQLPEASTKAPTLTAAGAEIVPPEETIRPPFAVIALLMLMSEAAASVSVVAAVQLIGAATVMVPACEPDEPVVTVTLAV